MEYLKDLRKSLNLSKREMAKKIGISFSYYEKIESGERYASRNFLIKLKQKFPQFDMNIFFSQQYTNSVSKEGKI
jgi:transcriptional regulator with XRE-family HTH domain